MSETTHESETPAGPTRNRGSLRIAALFVALLVVGGGFAGYRLLRSDPYRPGTTHAVTLTLDTNCVNLPTVHLDDRIWAPRASAVPDAWATLPIGTSVAGTLEVTAEDEADLRLDLGITLPYRRLPAGVFYTGGCSIR